MAQWTTMLHLITLQWQTLNSLGKMLQTDQLQKRESRPWAFRTDRSMDQPWDLLKVLFRPLSTLLLSFWIEMCQTSTRLMRKYRKRRHLPTLFHFWGLQISSGTLWPANKVHLHTEISPKTEPTPLDNRRCQSESKRRELSKWGGRTGGILTSSQSLNSTNKCTHPPKSRSRESEETVNVADQIRLTEE